MKGEDDMYSSWDNDSFSKLCKVLAITGIALLVFAFCFMPLI